MDRALMAPSNLETFSDEVFFEIFDRLSPSELYETFYGLNSRFNTILNDSRMRFRDNLSSLNPYQFHSYIRHVLPQIMDRLISFTFGTYDTDEVGSFCPLQDSHASMFHF